jgi:hypothetical protein
VCALLAGGGSGSLGAHLPGITTHAPSHPTPPLPLPPFPLLSRSSIVVVDAGGACASLSVFHLSEADVGRLDRDKHSLLVLDPVLKHVRVRVPVHQQQGHAAEAGAGAGAGAGADAAGGSSKEGEAHVVEYLCVQVVHPDTFFVDGRAVSKERSASASSVSVEAFDR